MLEATLPNLRMHLVSAFISLILIIHQTQSNTCIAFASYPGNETDRTTLLAFKDKMMIEDPQGIMGSWNTSGKCAYQSRKLDESYKGDFFANQLQAGPDGLSFITDLTNCTKLEVLDLGKNKFRGEIPASIANFTDTLQYLVLGSNQITGNIPLEIENLNGLQVLTIHNNDINGEIPHGIGKLQNLTYLYLWGNRISGAIPSSLGNATRLLRLALQYNQLEGDIPPSLGWCQQLQLLKLSDNNLNGTIPKEFISLSSLSINFDVARNSLTGPLPLKWVT
ncbi:probable LRR receptor-like serine/threonine-protein kinase At3g47570 [Eucalyptus grandis]|uniref:probable LRR receptor-like serine/threonine-protein kinase At3g47570 n=1 Tax=Eucalyptus grandis TaxID=71139 RepID=UPI00192EDCAE|nr:probable LRR receptor-like serine/threonine-protein kinase At3g47570 [Eucalyptus grandis]